MDAQEFKQLRCMDQISCNGILGMVLEVSADGVRILFDGDSGPAVVSSRDLKILSDLRVTRRAPEAMYSDPVTNHFRNR
jgi:hypothetical protein